MGFLIEPDRINTYFADREDPWEYTWVEFSGLKAKEILDTAGLSTETPVFTPSSPQIADTLKEELMHLASSSSESSSLHLIGHLYLVMDAILTGSSSRNRTPVSYTHLQKALSDGSSRLSGSVHNTP